MYNCEKNHMSNSYTQIHIQLFEVDFDERYIFKQPISIFDDKVRWIQWAFVVEKVIVIKEFAPKGAWCTRVYSITQSLALTGLIIR